MRRIRFAFCLTLTTSAVLLPCIAAADEGAPALRTSLFVETDPSTFVLGGFAAHARVRPVSAPHWSLGAGAYALNLPEIMVDLDSANRHLGWSSRIQLAASFFVDLYFRDDGEGAFVGLQLGAQRFRVTRDGFDERGHFTALIAMPRVGYTWRPFTAGFYVMPWLGLGVTGKVAGDVASGGRDYDVFPLVAFATVHAGWRF